MPKFLEHRVEEAKVPFEGLTPIEIRLTEYMAFSEELKINLTFKNHCDYQDRVKSKGGNRIPIQNFEL